MLTDAFPALSSPRFANQPANSLFRIDPVTGEVKTTASLGTESGRLFHLEVRSDGRLAN